MLVITSGEPAGIGPDIILQLASRMSLPGVVLGNRKLFVDRAQRLGLDVDLSIYQGQSQPAPVGSLYLWDQPLPVTVLPGKPDIANAPYVLSQLDVAIAGCLAGSFSAMVTAPVAKSLICEAGFDFTGHTEYLAAATGSECPVMLLASPQMRVALVTTHLPLAKVPTAITTQALRHTLATLIRDLHGLWGIAQPTIRVAGLNPHAGEGGYLGREELEVIQPALEGWDNATVLGPLSADTMFCDSQTTDAYVVMYHDQGLPVVKYASFGECANITLGLPIVRTSVDHGTAYGLAGTGQANPDSLAYALAQATLLAGKSR